MEAMGCQSRGLRSAAGPNVWRQWRAGEAVRVHCTPGLGPAEWKRGGLRKTEAAEERGKVRGRLGRRAAEAMLSRTPSLVWSGPLRVSRRFSM